MNSVNGAASSSKPARLWQIAFLTAAGAIGTASQADAAYYYWTDYSDGSYYARQDRRPEIQPQKPQKRTNAAKKDTVVQKEAGTKPQGPLVIVVSIERQKVAVYDSNGLFAESPVSTGMKGHSTPMGVFSIIQKHKFHHSNIYSGAPMPYMQRITWSGVAMHAGALPGYPASHGCIRMPMAFAMKMWNWTRMGARVIVTPGQMSPRNFSHPLLASVRVPPQPAASLAPQINAGDKADKGAQATSAEAKITETKPLERKTASADSVLELRTSLGHTVMSDVTTGNAPAREDAAAPADRTETRTAEASDAVKSSSDVSAKPAATDAKPVDAAEAPKASKTTDKPDATKTDAPALTASPDVKKDETRMADPAPAAKPDAPKRAGQIAVFISRKDSKLYVRQNFAPLFEVPVTIAPSDRPLGTHVFTAELDKADSNTLRWSVVSLPVSVRAAVRDDDGRVLRRKGGAAVIPVAAKPVVTPDSPAEALDRIMIPADTVARINEMLTTGGSIIVSDQGINQGETGEGTDFIVRLY
ncbi:L,D-transpeptidase family protein [Bradyrhizobium daqingense]|uniref:Lipoprotein-anchoring transpeptidase ErfK/SrfK n=1 Tax=Bradyrhizobium daqingense TaxID=993502 RepID=A0A562LG43_9BRAD|nr:L,D-transpeptidase [Bradyrhizobium daqingense]TWI06592.1 lipoprotein-anchoring transpeptidase ErfK/SrfK [Bradyrhizobium daqingense]UFS86494.1 L,D-transpeptidase family protein [Bradyrhizobium daqingense]